MKNTFIKDLKKGSSLDDETFLLTESSVAVDKNGNDYYKLTLSDKTGKIEGKIWNNQLSTIDRSVLVPGKLLSVDARVEDFKGIFQLNIVDAREAEGNELGDFMETSKFSVDEMMKELSKELETIQDSSLKKVILDIFNNEEINKKLRYWPAGKSVHHEFQSGLLQHILEMQEIKRSLIRFYPDVDYDILTAGIFLHDIGKTEELANSHVGATYTTKGLLIGHINIGVLLFTKFAEGKLDEGVYNHICHLILSHHGTHEFGSPVLPSTTEAVILSNIDNLSSKARSVDSATSRIMEGEEFSDFNKWLGGVKIWKGSKNVVVKTSEPENTNVEDDFSDPQLF